jgi:hypothetical protein
LRTVLEKVVPLGRQSQCGPQRNQPEYEDEGAERVSAAEGWVHVSIIVFTMR